LNHKIDEVKKIKIGSLLTAATALLMSFGPISSKSTLKVKIDNIKTLSGTLYVGIYEKNGFPEKGEQLQQKKVKVDAKSEMVSFQMTPGNYAIALYHDVNDNEEMDKSFFGYPEEPYGFSRNFAPSLSKPDFADCKVTLGTNDRTITISLIH